MMMDRGKMEPATRPPKFLFFDCETTGLSREDEILELALVDFQGNVLLDQLIKPVHKKEWRIAQRIHKIKPSDVEDAPALRDIEPAIIETISGNIVATYNAAFDMKFIPERVIDTAASFLCVMRLFQGFEPQRSAKLPNALEWAQPKGGDIDEQKQHRAAADAERARLVFVALCERHTRTLLKFGDALGRSVL